MISRAKYWMGIGKPKIQHSLDNLKYLYGVLNKNQIVTENNKDLLIETLRSISEILIWGDQNDSSVFDFFLEKQMITFFLHYMKQKYGRYICVQLLQTLNILFENIRNETSLYFLLSNNHINNIILNKFDFSDEEVMAYYISFLKTLSLKLNSHSIHFFFNERAAEFPLYVEAIKFFDHPESMVRIAVRTLTLNIFKVPVQSMQKYVKEKTANHYFSNMVWLIRNHVLDLDICVKNTIDHTKKCRLIDLIDEHIDHLNYLQDIYMINNQGLSNCLSEQIIRRLFVPVYLSSLLNKEKFVIKNRIPYIQPIVAIFLLSHFFSIISYKPLLNDICELLFLINDEKVIDELCHQKVRSKTDIDYLAEPKPLINCLVSSTQRSPKRRSSFSSSFESKQRSKSVNSHFSPSNDNKQKQDQDESDNKKENQEENNSEELETEADNSDTSNKIKKSNSNDFETKSSDDSNCNNNTNENLIELMKPLNFDQSETQNTNLSSQLSNSASFSENITDDEKYRQITSNSFSSNKINGIGFESLLQHLNIQQYNELNSLLTLSFLYTLINNPGVPEKFVEMLKVQFTKIDDEISISYNEILINKLIGVVSKSVEPDYKVRLATLEIVVKLIKTLVTKNKKSYINDFHLACIEQAKEQSSFTLRRQFKSDEMFLDMFEHEYQNFISQSINFEMMLRDWSILLTPTSTPLSGIEYSRRFPCGDTEKLKHSIRVFFLLRDLCLCLGNESETQLPLTKQEYLVKENDALDLNSSDLIACTVNLKEKKDRRFLVIDPIQFILVEPEVKRIGWGIVKFSDLIQDVEVTPDKEDSRSLNITIKKSNVNGKPEIVLNSVFTFDDHIRCMAAKQHLVRARDRARRMKLEKIAQLLDISSNNNSSTPNKNLSLSQSTSVPMQAASDILSYNLVAGLNSLGSLGHPGRASMISQTWSQIAHPAEKTQMGVNASLAKNPTTPLFFSQPPQSPTQPVTSPLSSTNSNANIFISSSLKDINHSKILHREKSLTISSPSSEKASQQINEDTNNSIQFNLDSSLKSNKERHLSSSASIDSTQIAKSLIANNDQSISLINSVNQSDHEAIASKIQILPPSPSSNNINTTNNVDQSNIF